ncbi:MAG: hypothetical protein KA375_02935 [Vitreoscilla sp.]|nr:hypothetical protein [Burkholderiales bacterium]MBP6336525.1 hypothetical protein [Vitreoscilla sp.]MBP6673798.1 hypothetical protein [Vitreoscilla sp.]
MSEDQLTPVPESFLKLYQGLRNRLLEPAATVRARYEFCEDLANQVMPMAQALHHDDGLAEDEVLTRVGKGLANPASGLREDEAVWVATRLAELLRWPMPPHPPM